ncbi:MAG: GNAT family N-acetyltransferase [Chloroflexi bacterium]|nr:GNAT family N-acetyltransferase [Chloroflexota bacterium]
MVDLVLRSAEEADLPLLAQMNRRLIEDEGSRNPMSVAQLQERMRGWLAEGYAARLFVEDGVRAVGYAVFRAYPDPYDPAQQYVYLRQFYVERTERRRGVGTRALALLCAQLPKGATVALDVLTSNPAGQAFWRSVGCEPYCTTMHLKRG